ncbi:MAG: stage II sporulation protein R [Acutalibacteraceae bacterium]|jgi:stage II sporulation protein R
MTVNRGIKAIAMGLAMTALVSLCGFCGECDGIRERVLRLHVLANSDTEADQALKLRVRDAVIERAAGLFDGIADAAAAKAVTRQRLDELEQTAEQVVAGAGYDYPVAVELTRAYFPTRRYDAGTLPAGDYDAIRVIIGKGEGHNWWCVAFPPLCVASASGETATLDDVLTPAQRDIVEQPGSYEARLKIVEWARQIERALRDWWD